MKKTLYYFTKINLENKQNSGVRKKIESQIHAFNKLDYHTFLIAKKNSDLFINDHCACTDAFIKNNAVEESLFLNRFFLKTLKHLPKDSINYAYIRYPLSSFRFIKFLKKLKKTQKNIKIIIEMPTYPYKKEIRGLKKPLYWIDAIYSQWLHKHVDVIFTCNDHRKIHKIRSISIENGAPLIPKREAREKSLKLCSKSYNLGMIANFSIWHGIDRLIKPIMQYNSNQTKKIHLHIIGSGNILEKIKKENPLPPEIIFHGNQDQEFLHSFYPQLDLAIGSLGLHRINIEQDKTLKTKEYASYGIPLLVTKLNKSFPDKSPFCLKIKSDESPVNISLIVSFLENLKKTYTQDEIKTNLKKFSEENFSWSIILKNALKRV